MAHGDGIEILQPLLGRHTADILHDDGLHGLLDMLQVRHDGRALGGVCVQVFELVVFDDGQLPVEPLRFFKIVQHLDDDIDAAEQPPIHIPSVACREGLCEGCDS